MAHSVVITALPDTTTSLPDGGLWLSVAPATWEVTESASDSEQMLVGGVVVGHPQPAAPPILTLETTLAEVYDASMCAALPDSSKFTGASETIRILSTLAGMCDPVRVTISEDLGTGVLFAASMIPTAVSPRRAMQYGRPLRCEFTGIGPAGYTPIGQASRKRIASPQVLRQGEDLRRFSQRLFRKPDYAKVIAKANNCDMQGVWLDRPHRRLTKLMIPESLRG